MTAVTRMLYNDSGSQWCTRGWCRQRTYRRDMVRGWRGEVDRYNIQYLSMYIYIYIERERRHFGHTPIDYKHYYPCHPVVVYTVLCVYARCVYVEVLSV